MQLKGQVLGYDDIATFEPVSPIQEKEANRDLPPPEEWEFDEDAFYEDTAAKEAIQEGGEGEMMISSDLTTILQKAVNLLEIHRAAFEGEADNIGCDAGNPDGGSAQDCSHCQLIRDIEEIDQILNLERFFNALERAKGKGRTISR